MWVSVGQLFLNWGGVKPSITYGPEDNRVKIRISTWSGCIRQEIVSSSEDGDDSKDDNKKENTLIGRMHSGHHGRPIYQGSGSLGPKFYDHGDDGEYVQWLRKYSESEYDIMTISHHSCLSDDILSACGEEYSLLEPCEVLTEEEWILGGLTPWIDSVDDGEVNLIHMDGTQEENAIMEIEKLEEPLHFNTTSIGIVVGQDVNDYPHAPSDWYRIKGEQVDVMKASYNYVDIPIKLGHSVLKWLYCGPQQCWVKLWKLWAEGGIRIQLGYQQCYIKMSDDEEEESRFSSFRGRLPRHQSSLQWSRLTESQSLKNRLTNLEELDERRRIAAQHIEAIKCRRKIIFDKRHKKRALQLGMMVMIQDARKLEFPGKFDAVWLGPYLVHSVFSNNSLQLETLNGELFPTRTFRRICKEYRA